VLRRLALYVSVLVLCASVGASEGVRKLEWDDLVPRAAPLENPFLSLTVDQRTDFEILIGILDMEKRGIITRVEQTYEDGVEIRHKLESDGLDVDFFLSEFDRLEREVMKRNRTAVSELDGKTVRIPGYALPLEHDGTAVTEMLLVPYVGACIHVPTPSASSTHRRPTPTAMRSKTRTKSSPTARSCSCSRLPPNAASRKRKSTPPNSTTITMITAKNTSTKNTMKRTNTPTTMKRARMVSMPNFAPIITFTAMPRPS